MSLFGIKEYEDRDIGTLRRSFRRWVASIELEGHGSVPLTITGDKNGPDSEALGLAKELPQIYARLRPEIERELFDHYDPYREGYDAGDLPVKNFPMISSSEEVWAHLKCEEVQVEPLGGQMSVIVAYKTEWDIEHTLGAFVQDGQLLELNGSIGA